jgi:hypothetical protein
VDADGLKAIVQRHIDRLDQRPMNGVSQLPALLARAALGYENFHERHEDPPEVPVNPDTCQPRSWALI